MSPTARVCDSILELVGATPVVRLARIPEPGMSELFVKLEHFNPTGSHKDRIAAKMLDRAEAQGLLRAGGTVVEASCGGFAVSLALACAAKGYRLIAVLPDFVTREHLVLLEAYGASVELTPAADGMRAAVARAKQIAADSGFYAPNQYENPENWRGHAQGEGAELAAAARRLGGRIDAFAMTVGTGGTLGGVGDAIRAEFPDALVAAIAVIREGPAAPDSPVGWLAFQGARSVDRTLEIPEARAWKMKQRLAREEGLLVGPTSGANVVGALHLARELGSGGSVYTLCCDTGERYFSLEGSPP